MLYVLNLAAGVDEEQLRQEIEQLPVKAFSVAPTGPARRPAEIEQLADNDSRVCLVDVMPHALRQEDPLPLIMRELLALKDDQCVLLVRHPFDPIPLRDLLAGRGYMSWAEERRPNEWYTYFYRCPVIAAAAVPPPFTIAMFIRAVAAGA
jgi:hypothetical protein